jgi:hypothetical protein
MDEVEEGLLEQRLRRSVAGHSPAAPEWLVGFIETVPAEHRTTGRLAVAFDRTRVRRSVFATVAVAAVFLAIVGSATLVAVRNGQGVEPGAPSLAGWTWQKADGTNVSRPYQVANGYAGSCGRDATLCTSPDGLHWTTPADPSIVAVDGGAYFVATSVARNGDISVATSESSSMANPSCAPNALTCSPTTVLWRSTDGLHWSRVNAPDFSGLTLVDVSSLSGFFVAYAAGTPDETGWLLTSIDGLSWMRDSPMPVQPEITSFGASGVQVGSAGTQWRTTDGTHWTQITVPTGWTVGVVYAIPSGGFVALGMSQGQSAIGYQILTSADGLTWRVDPGDLQGVPLALDSVGGRLFADVSASPLNASAYPDSSSFGANAFEIWQSADSGRTWQPLLNASGEQMSGLVTTVGGRLFISSPDPAVTAWRIAWVGTPPGMSPEVPVEPAATASSGVVPSATTPAPVAPAASGPVPAPTVVVPGASGSGPTSGEVSQPTPPATPSGGISQGDAIRLAAAAVADSPNAAPSSAAQAETGQASLVYGNPLEAEAQPTWVWLVTYGDPSGSGSGGTVVIDYATGAVVGMTSWTP